MGLKIVAAASLQGDGPANEDLVGGAHAAAWVLDGATGVGADALNAPSDAHWFVHAFDRRLTEALTAAPGAPASHAVREATRAVADDYAAALPRPSPDYPPSAAFVMARALGETADGIALELVALGDCSAYVKTVEGLVEVFDGAGPTPIDARSLDALKRMQDASPDATPNEISARLRPVLRSNRDRMNVVGGYWILSLDAVAADHLVRRIVRVDRGAPIVLASDGFTRAVDMLALDPPDVFYAHVVREGPEAVAHAVRAAEAADADCRRFPRFKRSDDATCAVLLIE
ncbi:MAG: hypothetical protein AAGC56_12830 [Pseudomonadota bacterium]